MTRPDILRQDDSRLMLAALLDSRISPEVVLKGFPGWLRLPDDWNTSSAPQDEHLFYFVAAGEFAAWVGGVQLQVDAGDLLWIPAGTAFHFWIPPGKYLQAYRFRLRMNVDSNGGRRSGGETWQCQGTTGQAIRFASAWPAQAWARQIAEEAGHHDALKEERLRGLLLCFFTELARLSPARHKGSGVLTRAQQESLVQFFAARARSRPSPADLAGHLRLSLDYFTRVFRRTFGQAPRHWLVKQRIQQAALRLLESRLTVSEVADEFGYESVFAFSRQFKTVLGTSPLRYREQESDVPRMR